MTWFPIFLNYDRDQFVGHVEIDDGVLKGAMSGAIIPALKKEKENGEWEIDSFGLVPRTRVDTRPDTALGELT